MRIKIDPPRGAIGMQGLYLTARPETSNDLFGEYAGIALTASVEVKNSPTIVLLNGIISFQDASAFGQSLIELARDYEGRKWADVSESDEDSIAPGKSPEPIADVEEPGEVAIEKGDSFNVE